MIKARIKVKATGSRMSQSIVRSIMPDNLKMTNLKVTGLAFPSAACFNVSYEGGIETFISTLEDMLLCIQAAKGTLHRLTENRME